MNLEDRIRSLAALARLETAPGVDVADRVVLALTYDTAQALAHVDRPWMWLAGLSSIAAVAVVVVALTGSSSPDVLQEVSESVSWVIQ